VFGFGLTGFLLSPRRPWVLPALLLVGILFLLLFEPELLLGAILLAVILGLVLAVRYLGRAHF
jgi:hypothetical protein